MTSEHLLTDKFRQKIFGQNLNFNGVSRDNFFVNMMNCDNPVIEANEVKIFDEKFGKKNIVTMNNVNYENRNKVQRQSSIRDSNKSKLDYMDNLKINDSEKLCKKSLGVQININNNSQLTSETIVEFDEDNHFQQIIKTHLTDSLELKNSESKTTNPTEAIISLEQSMNDSVVLNNTFNSFMIVKWLIIPLNNIFIFNHWVQSILRKACQKVYYTFSPGIQIKTEAISLPSAQITENNQMLLLLTEKFDHMNQQLTEIRVTSETTISSLVNEVQSLKITNKKISEDNDALVSELKKLSQMLEVIQFNSKATVKEFQSSGGIPPPPPPPPPLPPSQKTPKNKKTHTPKKSTIPQVEKRPVITMDDLLKVTLRKAPKVDKEKPKASASDPRPVISLEMLQNVKLKSIKQRSQNYKVRSPHSLKTRSRFQNVNLSPIMAGSVSPLSRILSRGENFRRRPRKILMSPRVKGEEDEETQEISFQ